MPLYLSILFSLTHGPARLSRFKSVSGHGSSITHTLAAQIKQAVSMDLGDGDGDIFEDLIQGTEGTTPKVAKASLLDDRSRLDSNVLTPGGAIDSALPKIHEHCRVDEASTFMPFFPPGRLIHLQVKRSDR